MTKLEKKAISPIYIISDSVGGTAQKITSAVLAQFPELRPYEIRRFPFVTDSGQMEEILMDAQTEQAMIVSTLVNKDLISFVNTFCQNTQLRHVDLMSSLTRSIENQYGIESRQEPGALHRLNSDYFNRVSAMEFAVRYDDGKEPAGLLKADIVILGVSRTSKTPLSLYLANLGYRVANLPIIPEVQIPEELFKVPARKIIGLTTNAHSLSKIRLARLASLGLQKGSQYSDQQRIEKELIYADELYNQLDVLTISVTDRSIEETAVIIEEHLRQAEVAKLNS